jgi:hypothetical protein
VQSAKKTRRFGEAERFKTLHAAKLPGRAGAGDCRCADAGPNRIRGADRDPSAVITDGTSRVNPSLYSSDVVAMTSEVLAIASMSQDSHLLVG